MKKIFALFCSALLTAGCAQSEAKPAVSSLDEENRAVVQENSQPSAAAIPSKPDWDQSASPSEVEVCKVKDGLPREVLAAGRGNLYNGVPARGPVGFPWTPSYFFPTEGELKFLMLLVSFEDTTKFTQSPADYWAPQASNMSDWANFWSQGKLEFEISFPDQWIDLPYKSTEAPRGDSDLASDILERLPAEVNLDEIDSLFIQWAPGIQVGTRSRFSMALNSIDANEEAGLDFRQTVLSTDFDFYQFHYEVRRAEIWGQLLHDTLHEMNMNLHGPGNGWGTGVGQNYRPNNLGGVSYAISAWEQFLVGWMDDSQVHCVSPKDLDQEQTVILTPLEIYGGERRALIIPISDSDVLVIESRRPVGHSRWNQEDKGLLAYTVNPQVSVQKDHIDEDCGNDPTHTKWAYYLFPDQEIQEASGWCGGLGNGFSPAIFDVGETLTRNDVRVELVFSSEDKDFVRITRVGPSDPPPGGYPTLGPPTPGGGWWNDCQGECALDLPNPAENFGYNVPTEFSAIPALESCEQLSQKDIRNGIAASREYRDKAGAEVAILVSTQWYAKNRSLDTNLDGVICSCQAPELSDSERENSKQTQECATLQIGLFDEKQRQELKGGSGTDGQTEPTGPSVKLPAVPENSDHGRPVDDPERIGPPSCDGLASSGLRFGIAGSFALRDAAGAPSAMVSTQWYSKLFRLDTNNDGVICSPEAPE